MSDTQLAYILSDFTRPGFRKSRREVAQLDIDTKRELKEFAIAEGWAK